MFLEQFNPGANRTICIYKAKAVKKQQIALGDVMYINSL
jgi:hypothetical protein